ncbi:MAG TPA: redoxin domain-containing protein [Cytophagaceae bacterium]|jgi:peroxiredoxin (alkyl hydroperoxide reductase subunit C)|nr:redoxin domain-containing protein [Cytophagaceae bacterium]
MALIGKKAPSFVAPAVLNGKEIVENFSLDQYIGKKYVVFFFYPKDFTFVCPTELIAFQDLLSEFESRDAVVVGCSTDTENSHLAWLNLSQNNGGIEGVTYPLIADGAKTIATNFGVLGGDYDVNDNREMVFHGTPTAYRGTFLIDKQGIVRHSVINDFSLGRNIEDALRMVDAVKHNEKYGEVCPANWNKGKKAIKATVESTAEYLAENKKINESINYSKRIQNAVIPDNRAITNIFKESFIFHHPKDIVSGDFPWMMEKGDDVYVAAVDCTGHGVPGAMLSLIGNFLLNDIIRNGNSLSPAVILDMFDEMVNKTLNTEKNDSQIKDGMDIALCKINIKTRKLEYSGAHRPLYHVAKGELTEYKGDKWAIGGGTYKNQTNFTNHEVNLNKGEAVYIFSDGLPDQFGGPNGRKFSAQRIKDVVINNSEDMNLTYTKMKDEFKNWMRDQKQTDDVLLIGIKF